MNNSQAAEKQGGVPARYAPAVPVNGAEPSMPFDREDFLDFLDLRFGVSEKVYEPLKALLANYGIPFHQLLGQDFPCGEGLDDLLRYEQAKLTVLAREMSRINKKWRSHVLLVKGSMSAVFGSSAPSSITHKTRNTEMLRYYLRELKNGIPPTGLASARPLLEGPESGQLEGGYFEGRVAQMSRYVADFITGRQRELLVEQNRQQGRLHPRDGYAFWPSHVSPAEGASEAIGVARTAFVTLLSMTPPNAHKDMARVRLLKDFFLDSEASYWREMHELYSSSQRDLPREIAKIDLRLNRQQIPDAVADVFGVETTSLPNMLVEQAECLVWLYGLKHDPFGLEGASPERQAYFQQLKQPPYLALAAAILFHLQVTGSEVRVAVPGETHPGVPVYKSFRAALEAAGVNLRLGPEANDARLNTVMHQMDTKALNYMVSLFSLAANAEDGETPFVHMAHVHDHALFKIQRFGLLAELPARLKPYSCTTAYDLMGTYMSCLKEFTYNPLLLGDTNSD